MPQFYSDDIKSTNLSKLQQIFPEVFSDGKVDWDMLQTALGESVESEKEHYRFEWNGKRECYRTIQTPSDATLKVDEENSIDFDSSENVIIEGDNLEVLKLLQKSYRGKIKMIYIDPPYNKAKDFVYSDSWSEPVANYLLQTEQMDNEGYLSTRTETTGRRHTRWLNMIYPRLYLARNLLKEDGVIFVSIDDDEVHNLRKIMDEIYGEENFAGTICWKKKTNGNNMGALPPVHDYILVYGKLLVDESIPGYPMDDSDYSNPDNHVNGPWTTMDLSANHEGPHFPITNEKTRETFYPPKGRYWVFNEKEVKKRIKEGRIIFGKSGNARPVQRVFLKDRQNVKRKMETWWDKQGLNSDGTKELSELLKPKIFTHSKPSRLIKKIVEGTTGDNDLILDFFAGSGTTAHAVMELNQDDKKDGKVGNRKYILVQLPEPTPDNSVAQNEGYKNIAQITGERVKRTKEMLGYEEGFRAFRLDSSNYKAVGIKKREPDESIELILEKLRMSMFADNTLVGNYKQLDVVFEYAIKYGFTLASSVTQEKCGNYSLYKLCDDERTVWFSFDEKVEMDIAESVAKGEKLVLLDGALDDSTKLNLGFEHEVETI